MSLVLIPEVSLTIIRASAVVEAYNVLTRADRSKMPTRENVVRLLEMTGQKHEQACSALREAEENKFLGSEAFA